MAICSSDAGHWLAEHFFDHGAADSNAFESGSRLSAFFGSSGLLFSASGTTILALNSAGETLVIGRFKNSQSS